MANFTLNNPGEGERGRTEVIREIIRRLKALSVAALSDGDKGDVTVSGGGATWTIDTNSVTFAKLQDISTNKLLGRATALSGDVEEITLGTNLSFTGTTLNAAGGGSGSSVTTTLAFGSSFTDKAQTVVTGQTWVTANSEIVAQVLTPAGTDPDEMRLLDLKPVISDLVAGTGFTVTLYSEPEAKGDYSVMCVGV